jgi:hypothetical protein
VNDQLENLLYQSGLTAQGCWDELDDYAKQGIEKFAELIVGECAKLNKHQSYELMGVITDVEEGDGFDDVCLNTVKRVAEHLAKDLKEHFGVEE